MSLWKNVKRLLIGDQKLSKILDIINTSLEVLKENLPTGFGPVFDFCVEENRKQLVKEELAKTISQVVGVVESQYDEQTYEGVKYSITSFKREIIEFIDSTDTSTLYTIQCHFENNIDRIDNLNKDDLLAIIKYVEGSIDFIKSFSGNQKLSDKIAISNLIDNSKDNEVSAYQQESECSIISIRKKNIFVPKIYDKSFEELRKNRYIIIEGSAGIGKTTLSEWLLDKVYSEHEGTIILKTNFENINNTIECMRKFVSQNVPTVIYLNDLFGSNILNVEPQRALDAIEKLENCVKTYNKLFIIINSRDNIIQILKEKLKNEDFNKFKNYTRELSTESYSNDEKLDFIIHFKKFLSKNIFKLHFHQESEIINKFNPRIITRFLNKTDKRTLDKEEISNLVETLRNPFDFYKEELELLSKEAKILLFNLFFLIPYMQFTSVNGKKYFKSLSKIKLDKELSVILLELDQWIEAPNKIRFRDPGIIDFINCYLTSPSHNSIEAITTIEESYYYFRQKYNIEKSEDSVKILFENEFEDELEFLGNKLFYLISNDIDFDLKLMADYISCPNHGFSIFNGADSGNGRINIGIHDIIQKALHMTNSSKVFEFLFLENQIDWPNRIIDYYEFEMIVKEFVSYVETILKFNIDEFITEFRNELSIFLNGYIKSIQKEIDEDTYYNRSMEIDTKNDFYSCYNIDAREFYKNQFAKKVYPQIDDVVKQYLLLKPLNNYLKGIDFDYGTVVDTLLWEYGEKGCFEVYDFTQGRLDDYIPDDLEFWETGTIYNPIDRIKIVEE